MPNPLAASAAETLEYLLARAKRNEIRAAFTIIQTTDGEFEWHYDTHFPHFAGVGALAAAQLDFLNDKISFEDIP